MERAAFFKDSDQLDFAAYLSKTHANYAKDKLKSVRSILEHYLEDIQKRMKCARPDEKAVLGRLKTTFSDVELQELLQKNNENNSDAKIQNFTFNTTVTGNSSVDNLNVGSNVTTAAREASPQPVRKRQKTAIPKPTTPEPTTILQSKRQRKPINNDYYVDSGTITDDESDPPNLGNTPTGFRWEIGMCELSPKDVPKSPLPIPDKQLATLVADAGEKAVSTMLHPLDIENRLHLSAIFSSKSLPLETAEEAATTVELPDSIYKNILALKRAIQQGKLYVQPHPTTTMEESCLNTILLSTYTLHGKPRIKTDCSELHLIANSLSLFLAPFFSAHDVIQLEWDATSWIYRQLNETDKDKLRPDILLHVKYVDRIIEIGCGEVKKAGVPEDFVVDAKIRVLEIMKRQLHLRMKFAKKMYEAETFGIVVDGTTVILLDIHMDMAKGVYVYNELPSFSLPTTYETHSNLEIAMEAMAAFKRRILGSLRKSEDNNNDDNVWGLYKNRVRPTASSFEPVYDA